MNASLNRLASGNSVSLCRLEKGNKHTLRVGKSNSKSLGLGFSLTDICCSIPNPASVTANIGRKLHFRNDYTIVSICSNKHKQFQRTIVIGADLQSLISPHDQSCLAILLVLQESNITSPTLLPFISLLVELEELCTHLENLLLELLVGLDLNFLGQTDDWFEVDIF
jgi:hypothetical protein